MGSPAEGRGGGATLSSGDPPDPATLCVRFAETEIPWSAQWIPGLGMSRFRGCSGSPLGRLTGSGGFAPAWDPAGLRRVGSRQGAPFPGPFTHRNASPGSCETNARKSRIDSHRLSNTRGASPSRAPRPTARPGRGVEYEGGVPQLQLHCVLGSLACPEVVLLGRLAGCMDE